MPKAPKKPTFFRTSSEPQSTIRPKSVIQPATSTPKKPAPKSSDEMLYYGIHTCLALFKTRKNEIIRAYCTEEHLDTMGAVLKWCATNKKAYHVVSKEDLERITQSVHHEGVAILAKRKQTLAEEDLYRQLKQARQPIVVLDDVLNPHNIGSIMRTMAHFGWKYLISSQSHALQLSSSAARMSEGGCEFVEWTFFSNPTEFLHQIKSLGYHVIGTSAHARRSLYKSELPAASAIFFGNEVQGLSKYWVSKLDSSVSIPSSGNVRSVNVAMASALVLGEYVRQHGVQS